MSSAQSDPTRPPPLLLERGGELDAIERALAAAREQSGSFVVIEGQPGSGKTTLLSAARARASAAGMVVAHARGGQLEREFAFGVARQLFEPVLLRAPPAERRELLDGAAAVAGQLVNATAPTFERASPPDADDTFRANHALYWLAANLAARAPSLLVVDDLQWCDAASLRWLAYLTRRVADLPLLVVAAVHAGDALARGQVLAEIVATGRLLPLAPLGPASVARLIGDALGAEPAAEFGAACLASTGGNPLLVRELLAALAEQGVAPDARHVARVAQIGSRAVARFVHVRLQRLGADAGALARAIAVLGDGCTIGGAAVLARIGREAATAAAAALSAAGLLSLDRPLSFSHPLEAAAIYESIPPLQRELAHASAARMLAAEGSEAERICAHLLGAPSQHEEFAVEVLRRAARAAIAHGASETAVGYLRRALLEPLDAGRRADLLAELGVAERLVDVGAAAEHLREALSLVDGEHGVHVAMHLARTLVLAGRSEEAVGAFEHALRLADPRARGLRRRLQADLLAITMLRPQLYPAVERQLDAVEPDTSEGDVATRMLLAVTAYHDARRGRARATCADRVERALAGDALLDEHDSNAAAYACRVLVVADRFDAAAAV